jgi:UDP-glucuronate 4-epimerase
MKKILVTGAAGFIGHALSKKLTEMKCQVVGIDNLNDYYDVKLKKDRLNQLKGKPNFKFIKLDLANRKAMEHLFKKEKFEIVINLAAQAGVRYSLKNPYAYGDSNLIGFLNVLEGCRNNKIKHLIFASSSSVYGLNKKMPFSEKDNVDEPISLYAATKKSNELMAHAYSKLYKIPSTGLRFFTVYGPFGRPDMAYFSFTKAIREGKSIDVFNNGKLKRDFTYIDDIVDAIIKLIDKIPESNYKIYNIGNNKPVELMRFIEIIEKETGKKAIKNMLPMQPGDVLATYANINELKKAIGFVPKTSIEDGLKKFIKWYKDYYK